MLHRSDRWSSARSSGQRPDQVARRSGDYFTVTDEPMTQPHNLKSENGPSSSFLIGCIFAVVIAAAGYGSARNIRSRKAS